jgi:hypothetical protein
MVRYVDSAHGEGDGLGAWLETNLLVDSQALLIQSAWFSYGTLGAFAGVVAVLVERSAELSFVIGSNVGSLTKVDLERLWNLVAPGDNSRLAVIRYRNATFHPKVFYIEREDGSRTALIGSANLTPGGTEWNVEAGIVLDTRDGDDEGAFDDIRAAIGAWFERDEDGVFRVEGQDTIDALADDGVIDVPQPKRVIEPDQPAGKDTEGGDDTHTPSVIGLRKRFWKPPSAPPPEPVGAVEGEEALEEPTTVPEPLQPAAADARWAKRLSPSDAQQPPQAGTNPTGKLRLTKAGLDIDHITHFRHQLFGDETWEAEVRTGNVTYEVAMVDFRVLIGGQDLGTHTLMIDYALHRVANQANVPTVLAWGTELGRELARTSRAGEWVVIERLPGPTYRLTIQPDAPDWA